GPPERMIAFGANARMVASSTVHGRISEYTPASRTRRAISWVYWEPKSRIRTRSVMASRRRPRCVRRLGATPRWSCRLGLPRAGRLAAHEHAFDAQVLVEVRPVHAKRRQFVVG